ncbi:IPT/TIG domain-containing protein [Streptomyces sp. NBC_00193]|uniref:OmpL47-type beta-barrel domain-containing protein n=1 Tax=unclassified Streptomyces TaxID=2593676 RepID=UPI0022522F47|nr:MULTISPECIES: IPT/TIG domain-containing protein [unclassified Streptomyces]MCX5129942.1 IPT/TIG domain-containing protein [Streptomyces sp. NBC_00347]MCX5300379.1 IPT/TIG domain-containing protein [Streptomyces sp. NBC_00193]
MLRAAREWSRTAAVALTVTLTLAASANGAAAEPQPGARTAASSTSQADSEGHLARLKPERRVEVRSLPRVVPRPGEVTKTKPFMPAPKVARPVRPTLQPTVPVSTSVLVPKSKVASKAVPSTAVLERLKTFPGLGQDGKTPSDAQIAVGPTYIVEMVNFTGQIYDKAGNTVGAAFDLGDFFGMAHRSGTDPRVHYDAAAGRFYAEFEADLANGDRTDLAVSDSSDPRGGWTFYTIAENTSNVLQDQAKLGYSNDKVTLSWNNYDRTTTPRDFLGVVTVVVNKAELLAGGTITIWTFNQDDTRFQVVPATSQSAVNDQFAMWHGFGSDSPNLRVLTITGVPGVSTVSQTENTFGIGTSDNPPNATQPAGGDAFIKTNDNRILSVAWQNNRLWGVFNVSCTPPGDTAPRACQRFVRVSTGGTQSLVTNFNLGLVGGHIYYGSVAMNDEDDLFSGFTASSSTMFPTAVAIGVPGGDFPGTTVGDFYAAGTQAFVCGCGTGDPRWGDYSGTARDPSNPKDVWTVQQIGGLAGGGWGTAMDRVTLSPPAVTAVVPNHGPELAQCVNTVTVQGKDFPTSGTTVKFGSVSASNVNVTGPEELTADVPPQARGTVDVTVTTPNGTSPMTAADRYTYDADTSAPTASAGISPSSNTAGWNTTSPATVNISASDGSCGSGITKITYSASGAQPIGPTDVSGASASVAITTNGVTTVTYTATDNAGNTSAPQTITVRLDTAGPTITIVRPAGTYLYRQPVTASYSCTDATSGVASCVGAVPNGSPINTTTLGSHTFTVNATDNATNPSTKSVTYNVAYRICLLYDPNRPVRLLGQVVISLRICDANGNNLSSPNITLTASRITGPATRPVTGRFNYNALFRSYSLPVSTWNLPNGNYNLEFTISGADTTTHLAPFTLR